MDPDIEGDMLRAIKQITKPKALKKDDMIGIFSPSEPLTPERRVRVERGANIIHSLGYSTVYSENMFNSHYYMAGKPEDRISDFNDLIRNIEVKAIMMSWGGKSANQLMNLLDYELIAENPKAIFGFSDTTNLINAIHAMTGLVTFHGPNVVGKLDELPDSSLHFFDLMIEHGFVGPLNSRIPPKSLRDGVAQGRLIGGNLSCFILGLMGTPYQPDFRDAIFFWEAGSRSPQEIDQFLTYLKLAGVFAEISGMIIGHVSECRDKRDWGSREIEDVVVSTAEDFDFPIMVFPAFGHGDVENITLPIGCRCKLDSRKLSFEIQEKSVSGG
jgi:muramoyltetrapeptide carboxypeptidase